MPLGEGHPLEREAKRGAPPKTLFCKLLAALAWKWLQISTDILLIITITGYELLKNVNIDDLEWPWTPKMNFSRFRVAAHISRLNCAEMAGDRSRQPAYEIFSIKCRFYQSKSGPSRFKKACAVHTWVAKRGTSLKSSYLSVVCLSSMKMVADRHRHVAYHNKHWQQAS